MANAAMRRTAHEARRSVFSYAPVALTVPPRLSIQKLMGNGDSFLQGSISLLQVQARRPSHYVFSGIQQVQVCAVALRSPPFFVVGMNLVNAV